MRWKKGLCLRLRAREGGTGGEALKADKARQPEDNLYIITP